MIFTEAERAYISDQGIGRLATIGPDGSPQAQPVSVWFDAATELLHIGGRELHKSQKYRNVLRDPRVSFVIDDESPSPASRGKSGRGIEIRATVEVVQLDPPLHPAFDNEALLLRPTRVISWNLEPGEGKGRNARNVGSAGD